MHAAELFEMFEAKVRLNPEGCISDYLNISKKVEQSTAWYKGKPVEFLYQPMFYTQEDLKRFKALAGTMTGILDRVIEEYINNTGFRKEFSFPAAIEDLILADTGYPSNFPIARYDIFYHYNDNFRFCEINGDGASSMNESRELYRIFKESSALEGVIDTGMVYDYEMIDSWIDVLIGCYSKFCSRKEDLAPATAIVDFEGEGIVSEFKVFMNRMKQRGMDAFICDPRELSYRKGSLYYREKKVGLVYRRATTARIIDNLDSVKDFINAYMDGAVCVVGSFKSQIIHNKRIFALLHDETASGFLDTKQREFIRRHVPFTAVIDDEKTARYALHNREKLVIKPLDSFGAHGVYLGKHCDSGKWKSLVSNAAQNLYIVQELCDIPVMNMPTIEDRRLSVERYNYLTGLFVYNGRFNGFYTRAGRKDIIASIAESFTLANFILR